MKCYNRDCSNTLDREAIENGFVHCSDECLIEDTTTDSGDDMDVDFESPVDNNDDSFTDPHGEFDEEC